jgi:soluble lytic murein transglycosylase-like protein
MTQMIPMTRWISPCVTSCVVVAWCLSASSTHAAQLSGRAERCIKDAAMYHHVGEDVLRAIVWHESRGKANTVVQNANGSIDVGLAGTNSIHFNELQKKGVAPADLLDECYAIYVGAWMYSQKVYTYGNNWFAVGAYHSKTPYYNQRYQALIYNELVKMGAIKGGLMAVPSLSGR